MMKTRKLTTFLAPAIIVSVLFLTGCGDSDDNSQQSSFMQVVHIKGGTFTMGSPDSEPNRVENETQHEVTLKGFYMGKYPVTQAQYQEVMGTNPSFFDEGVFTPPVGEVQKNRPVENVSWYDAIVFCNKLSMIMEKSPAYRIKGSTDPAEWGNIPTSSNATWNAVQIVSGSNGYTLPTEEQWEYACRAGTTTAYNTGDEISDDTGWYKSNSDEQTHEVGKKPRNAWGLYDMHGNVFEWCWDWFDNYPDIDKTVRVIRGGACDYSYQYMRSAYRGKLDPSSKDYSTGFRVVRP